MYLEHSHLEKLLKIGIDAALEAGKAIQSFNLKNLSIQKKEDAVNLAAQVLTEADLRSQEIILHYLNPTLKKYDLGLLSEEAIDNNSRFEKDYFWCIDPLDGTLPFTEGTDGYCINIALVTKEGKSVLGILFNPKTYDLFYNHPTKGLFKNDEPFNPQITDEGLTLVFDRSFLQTSHFDKVISELKSLGYSSPKIISYGGAGMNAIWVLEANSKAAYFKFPKKKDGGGSLWDYAATSALFKSAEFYATTCSLDDLPLNQNNSFMNQTGVLFCNHKALQKDLNHLYKEITKSY